MMCFELVIAHHDEEAECRSGQLVWRRLVSGTHPPESKQWTEEQNVLCHRDARTRGMGRGGGEGGGR